MNSPEASALNQVTVRTGARIHFGLLTHRPKSGREFGGVGVMVDSPGWQITVSTSAADCGEASEVARLTHPGCVERASQILDKLRASGAAPDRPIAIEVEAAIPAHQGLGSGSQLALALARGLDRLVGRESPIEELSCQAGRGGRSAVGTWGFELGGLLVDGGRGSEDLMAPLVTRVDVPEDWRFVLLLPRDSAGLSGNAESDAFRKLAGMSDSVTDRLCRIIVMQLVPAFRGSRFEEAAQALGEYGQLAGDYFAEIQGGLFTHPQMRELATMLADAGAPGLAQTSWGPGCAMLCRDANTAERIADLAKEDGSGWLETRVVSGRNRGADVDVS